MSIYVDKSANNFGRMVMCHMIADTPDELHEMAVELGLERRWFQANSSTPHFDICKSKRARAIALGAVELDRRPFVDVMKRIRQTWPHVKGVWQL